MKVPPLPMGGGSAAPAAAAAPAKAPEKKAAPVKVAKPEADDDDEPEAAPAKDAKQEKTRDKIAAPPTKTTKAPTQDAEEDVDEETESDESDEQDPTYESALKTLANDRLTAEDLRRLPKSRVLELASQRAQDHSKTTQELQRRGSQPAETTHSGLQERHVKELAALFDEDAAQGIHRVISETAAAYTPVIEKLTKSLEDGEKARAGLEQRVEGLSDELRFERLYRKAVAEDPTIATDPEAWDSVVAQMRSQQRTGNYKRTPKGESRLVSDSLAIVNRDRNKTLQTDRARDRGQVQALGVGTPGDNGTDKDLAAFRAATASPI